MIFFLKILWDTSFYYMFAMPIAGYFGGGNLLTCMILQCAVYTLSRAVKNKFLRVLPLLLLGLCFIYPAVLADRIALLPITLYILWQVLWDRPAPDISRQRQWLEDCWKVLVLAVAAGLIVKDFPKALLWAVVWLLSNIALLRTLRHGESVRSDPGFHLVNIGLVISIPAVSLLLGSESVVSAITTPLNKFYQQVLLPVLVVLLWIPFMLLQWLFALLFPGYTQQPHEDAPDMGEFHEYTEQMDFQIPPWVQSLFWTALILTAAALLYFLLRTFLKPQRSAVDPSLQDTSTDTAANVPLKKRFSESSSAQSIRRQYRRFLKLCRGQGIHRTESTTSLDIHKRATHNPNLSPFSRQIRQLYIKARYAGRSDTGDVKEMLRLCSEAKRSVNRK